MTEEIVQLLNHHSPWTKVKSGQSTFWFKGNIFYNNKLLNSIEIVNILSSVVHDEDKIAESFSKLNGEYAIVVETPDRIGAIVDRVRSIPLFYSEMERETIITDDANLIKEAIPTELDELNATEFLLTGFVTGPDTLFNNIRQLQAGEYLIYDKKRLLLKTDCYYHFLHGNYFADTEDVLLEKLDQVFLNVFKRLIDSTVKQGKRIVVPLSGGLDSRIIVTMLKRLGVENVICFTYGKKGNKEAVISKQVAEALGYEWHFVEYTEEKLYNCYHSKETEYFLKYASNLVSLPHLQDFLAVKKLKSESKIPENAVFVPGHTGDMISGGHIPLDYEQSQTYNYDKFFRDNLKKHYNLWKWDDVKPGSIFKERIRKSVGDISVHDNESCANAIEHFDFNERQAKFIVNSVRVYEFLGYGWQIPLWDAELMDYFLRTRIEYRINQRIYIKYFIEKLCSDQYRFLTAIECTTELNNNPKKLNNNLTKTLKYVWSIMNVLYGSYFNLDIGWSVIYTHPLLQKIRFKINGADLKPFNQNISMCEILNYSNKKRFVPSTNAIMVYIILKQQIQVSE